MAKGPGISGLAVGMVAVGGLLIYASLHDYTMLDALRYVLRGGRGPAPTPKGPSGGGGTPATSAPGGPATGLTKPSTQFRLPVSGSNKPLP